LATRQAWRLASADPWRTGESWCSAPAGSRAAQAADLAEIPAMVRTVTDREALEVQVIETYSG